MMIEYEIEEIYGDGYERWAKIKFKNSIRGLYVHWIEYDEYLEDTDIPTKRKRGDTIRGILKISLVTEFKVIKDNGKGYIQSIKNSCGISAIANVKRINDSDTIVCRIEDLGEEIVIEFENDIEIELNTTIEINGSLELDVNN